MGSTQWISLPAKLADGFFRNLAGLKPDVEGFSVEQRAGLTRYFRCARSIVEVRESERRLPHRRRIRWCRLPD